MVNIEIFRIIKNFKLDSCNILYLVDNSLILYVIDLIGLGVLLENIKIIYNDQKIDLDFCNFDVIFIFTKNNNLNILNIINSNVKKYIFNFLTNEYQFLKNTYYNHNVCLVENIKINKCNSKKNILKNTKGGRSFIPLLVINSNNQYYINEQNKETCLNYINNTIALFPIKTNNDIFDVDIEKIIQIYKINSSDTIYLFKKDINSNLLNYLCVNLSKNNIDYIKI
ncbi:hypothetical protein AB837_00040 [bacterium AB1]|nr:hypothetical protein AB837_00040 [bacterium AB1]